MKSDLILKYILALAFLLFSPQCHLAYGTSAAEPAGEQPAPQFTLPAPESAQAQQYLGLKKMEPFSISDVGAKLVVIEFVSAMCPKCHANAPVVNRLYKLIQEDPALAKNIKVIGVAVGNGAKETDAFKKTFKVPFPMFPDESFAISAALEGVETPSLMVLATGSGKILVGHDGVITDFDLLVKDLREILKKQ